jgi:hypothetical protein
VTTGFLLRIHEAVVAHHLENTTLPGDEDDFRDVVFEFCEYALRQTDGSRGVASLGAVFN